MKRSYMIFEPFGGTNAYIENMKKCWEHFFTIIAPEQVEKNLYLLLNTRAVVLNWTENQLTREIKKRLLRYRLLGIRIIWVYHNRIPHRLVAEPQQMGKARRDMDFMVKISDVIILHSRNSRKYLMELTRRKRKVFYVPHIDYENQYRWTEEISAAVDSEPFRFVFQGTIAPYKNIEMLIRSFKELNLPDSELYIAGKPSSVEYGKKIRRLCQNGNIFLKLEFLSDRKVGEIIRAGDILVLPYDLRSSMNSGTMLAAFSNRRTVIISNNAMAQDYSGKDFLYTYDYLDKKDHLEQLKKTMQRAYNNGAVTNRKKGWEAFAYTRTHNSEEAVVRHLEKIVGGL